MEFSVNHPVLFLLAGILIAVVLAQSVFFLVKALRRSKELGMDQTKIRKTIKTAALFTIAPAVSIVISVITLSKSLGIPLPWLRLSVVGSLSYEAIAASNAVSAMGLELGKISSLTAQQYVNITLVMTLSIMVGIWLVPVLSKKLLRGMSTLEKRDAKWADIFQNALFIGMISAFLGYVFCDFSRLWTPGDYSAAVAYLDANKKWNRERMEAIPGLAGLFDAINTYNFDELRTVWAPRLRESSRFADLMRSVEGSRSKRDPRTGAHNPTYLRPGDNEFSVFGYRCWIDP